ncbi:MAG: HAMP domain-containing histidine kinase [Bacteroidetes bacterium]|nr:HAMP domain-containing histidine kinase [Bacteroidota bacterium]MBS1650198.1 HAMP domain-containing histidine kinase [Bacteroidota bacterium]
MQHLRKAFFKHGYLLITAAWLYTFSFIVSNYFTYDASPEKIQSKLQSLVTTGLEKVDTICKDTTLINQCLDNKTYTNVQVELTHKPFGFFVYAFNDVGNPIITFWNSNSFYVKPEDLQRKDGNYFVHYQNGDYVLHKKTIALNNKKALCIGVLPVRWQYFIENEYLSTEFYKSSGIEESYDVSTAANALQIKDTNGNTLFGIVQKGNKYYTQYDTTTIVLRTLAIIALLLFLNYISVEIALLINFRKGFLLLVSSLFILRLFSYLLPFPFDFTEISLFDPSVYASNRINKSLGDLLINTIFIFWVINFYKSYFKETSRYISFSSKKYIAIICIAYITLICLNTVNVIRSLVIDSKISFTVTDFFSLSIYSYVSFVILCLLALSFFYLTQLLLKPVVRAGISVGAQLLIVCITGLAFFSFNIGNAFILPGFMVLLWLMFFLWILNYRSKKAEETITKSSLLVFWMMFFAVSMSAMLIYQNKEVELLKRKRLAETLSLQGTVQEENLLSIATSNFSNIFLENNFQRFYNEYSNKFLKDSLISKNFSGLLNKYETRIYTYDSLYKPLYNDDSAKYAFIKTIRINQAIAVDSNGLYSFSNKNNLTSYLFEKSTTNNDGAKGYLFILIKPRKFISEAIFPVLFKQGNSLVNETGTHYAYAVYNNGKLINHENEYAFPIEIPATQKNNYGYELKTKVGFTELWYYANNNKQVVIVAENNWLLQFITLFAYLLTSFLAIVILFYVTGFLIKTRFSVKAIKHFFQTLAIRSQINLIIVGVCLVSFIVIGVATVSFFIVRFNNNNKERLFKSIRLIADEIQSNVNAQFMFDDVLTINDIGITTNLEKKIIEIAETNNVDINFYNTFGKLTISTQPYIYNKYLLSDKMQPMAFYQLHYKHAYTFAQTEKIAKLNYLSLYVPLTDENGKEYAYLNIPYLNSQAELNEEISGFLATLINLNAFIFLLAGAIAFLITNRITHSFSLISTKMKELSLGKTNEQIIWERNDEIGELVNEYNKMLNKLEASANALAKAERESAWREMAKQVAHEIKNPLTPMKLSIQYLQHSMEAGNPNIKELSNNVITTLIEQINQLSNIAGDFSQFANINNAKPERYDISDTINTIIQMHQTNTNIVIKCEKETGNYFVWADKTQMSRLFTNLVKNAIEATEKNEKAEIIIHQKQNTDSTILIAIEDNGEGIDDAIQSKIFTPNFTTKSSGTGLGLAICKGIVENVNGKIWFSTQHKKGTVFYVELNSAT